MVQETVAHLGELDSAGQAGAKKLARLMTGRTYQCELFEDTPPAEAIEVRLDRVRLERGRRFGDVWLGWTLWRALKLDELLEELLPQGRESVPWPLMAAVLVVARLCEPSSELHIAENWYRRTALEDLLGIIPERVNDDRLYRALDRLVEQKEAIQVHLKRRLGELFSLDYDLLLYDVTSTFFEGEMKRNPQAKRGHSRDNRPDCKQVCIALVVTREGIPLGYEVFDGNRVDVTTVEEVVSTMESRYGLANRIWVMDRGMMSAKNIAWLQNTGRRYIIGTPKSELRKWATEIADAKEWQLVREGVEAKLCPGPDGVETFVLCRSVDRREKEQAMHQRHSSRIEEALNRLENRLLHARKPLDRGPVERQIGRLLQRNTKASSRYTICVVEDATLASGLRLQWSTCDEWDEWARLSEGCYVLRTNVSDWTPETLWRTYIQLTEAEDAFRIHKSDLSIRPIWHQKESRAQAHILVCFLAYALWKTLEQWQSRAGLGSSPRTIFKELKHIQSTDVVLPTAFDLTKEIRIRCVVRPDRDQAALLERLGLRLPERLRVPQRFAKM